MSILARLAALERRRGGDDTITVCSDEIEGQEPACWQPIARRPGEFWAALRTRAEFEQFCREHTVVWRRYILSENAPDDGDEDDEEIAPWRWGRR